MEAYMITVDAGRTFTIMCPMCDASCYSEDSYDGPVTTCSQCGERYFIGKE